jgi:hypothetical protein
MTRRFTAASLPTPSVARFSSMLRRSWYGSSNRWVVRYPILAAGQVNGRRRNPVICARRRGAAP